MDDSTTRCIFELLIAIQLGALCKLELIIPPAEAQPFMDMLLTRFDEILKVLSDVQLEKAQASKQEDRIAINEMVQTTIGFQKASEIVTGGMRSWLLNTARALLKKNAENRELLYNVGLLEIDLGSLPEALACLTECLRITEAEVGHEHPHTATTRNNIGAVLHNQGKYPAALEMYDKCLKTREKVLGRNHPDTASTKHKYAHYASH